MKSFIRSYLLAVLFIIASIFSLFAEDGGADFNRYETKVIQSFYKGDDRALYESVEALLLKNPSHPLASLYYKDLFYLVDVAGSERVEKALRTIIDSIARDEKNMRHNEAHLQAKTALLMLLAQIDPDKAKTVSEELAPIRKWRIVGPFRKYGFGDIDQSFGPEYATTMRQFEGSKKIETESIDGSVNLRDYCFPDAGVAYAITSFQATPPIKVRIYCDTFYRAYINGREVAENGVDNFRRVHIVRVDKATRITLMMKLYSDPSWKFRITVTDGDDAVVRPEVNLNKLFSEHFEYTHLEDHVYQYCMDGSVPDKAKACGYIGNYLSELDSRHAIEWYRKAIAQKGDRDKEFFLADMLIHLSEGDRGSAKFLEGWRIIDSLYAKDKNFVPVAHMILRRSIQQKDYAVAIREGKRLLSVAPRYMNTYIDLLRLYSSLRMKKEFIDTIALLKKEFPYSIMPFAMEAEFWEKLDREKCIKAHKAILEKRFKQDSVNYCIKAYSERGDYAKAFSLLDSMSKYRDWSNERIDLFMKSKRLSKAKRMIFNELVKKNDPSLYYRLGLIEFFKDMDPSMQWERMLALNPSVFVVSDYLDFMKDRSLINPFVKFEWPEETAREIQKNYNNVIEPSIVLSRAMVFKLNRDGSSRVFCDDVVYVNTQYGVEEWGEYKIPFRGKLHPIHARVFNGDGEYYDSYSVNQVDSDTYLSIQSLKEKSILHLSYIVDNPINEPKGSTFFSLPITLVHRYEQGLKNFSCIVITPKGMPVSFLMNRKNDSAVIEEGDYTIHSFTLKDLPLVHGEYFSGGELNCLPYFSFSTMKDIDDFIRWYGGLVTGLDQLKSTPEITALKGSSVEDTVRNVYDFIAREIRSGKNVLYYPGAAEDTLYTKKGAPEDKVLLAKSILEILGVQSYISFVPKRFLLKSEQFISPYMFSHILLYIPISIDEGIWLDFTSQHLPCGVVTSDVEQVNSLVLLKNGYVWKEAESRTDASITNKYRIVIDGKGGASFSATSAYYGIYGSIREYFTDQEQNEENVHLLYSKYFPSLEMKSFAVANSKDYSKPLEVSIKGESINQAIIGLHKVILQPIVNKSGIYSYILYPERSHPLWISVPIHEKEEYEYILPVKGNGNEINDTRELKSRFGRAMLRLEKKKNAKTLRVIKEITIDAMYIEVNDYDDFMRFCLQIKDLENITMALNRD